MLKAIATIGNRRTLIIGLERENWNRINADMPIALNVRELLADSPNTDAIDDIWLIGGETLADVHAQLKVVIPTMPDYEEPTPP